jgi:biotin operon repressor
MDRDMLNLKKIGLEIDRRRLKYYVLKSYG